MATNVIHKDTPAPADAVYIGRPTKWGNPYTIGKHGTRDMVIKHYAAWFNGSSLRAAQLRCDAVRELKDKTLVCHCKPRKCHGDIIAAYVNGVQCEELL